MSLNAITCAACGGAIALEAGKRYPACLFCGSEAISAKPMAEGVEHPEVFLGFETDEAAAKTAFSKFTQSSIWYPGDLRNAEVQLNQVMLPAWSWSGKVEGHYAALVSAATRSGKRPVSGTDSSSYKGVMVPSSKAISRAELQAISPFDGDKAKELGEGGPGFPYEVGALTRTAARAQGCEVMAERHKAALKSSLHASDLRVSAVFSDIVGRPLLLPIWIGAYRRKDKVYRVVVNGQTGRLHGEAPLSFWRIAAAVSLVLALLGGLVLAGSATSAHKSTSHSSAAPAEVHEAAPAEAPSHKEEAAPSHKEEPASESKARSSGSSAGSSTSGGGKKTTGGGGGGAKSKAKGGRRGH